VARTLAEQGDELVLLARSAERGEQLAEMYPGAEVLVLDLADPSLEGMLRLVDPPAELDSLVHVAGVVVLSLVADLTEATLTETLHVNLVAPALLTRWALPGLRAAAGTVVFVSSTAARTAGPQWSAYAASKAGLGAFADVLRAEEARNGVRVCTVLPSRTATPMQQRVRAHEGGGYDPDRYLDPASVADAIVTVLDLPVDATITEIVLRPTGRR
jgi:NADP-dependent 3-hydroxy acid dehydrogenase YdfG